MSIYRVDKKNSGYPDSHLFKNSFFEKLFRIEMESERFILNLKSKKVFEVTICTQKSIKK